MESGEQLTDQELSLAKEVFDEFDSNNNLKASFEQLSNDRINDESNKNLAMLKRSKSKGVSLLWKRSTLGSRADRRCEGGSPSVFGEASSHL